MTAAVSRLSRKRKRACACAGCLVKQQRSASKQATHIKQTDVKHDSVDEDDVNNNKASEFKQDRQATATTVTAVNRNEARNKSELLVAGELASSYH